MGGLVHAGEGCGYEWGGGCVFGHTRGTAGTRGTYTKQRFSDTKDTSSEMSLSWAQMTSTKKNAASAVCENHSVHATTPLLLFLRITRCSWDVNTRWGWSRRCGCHVGWPASRSRGRGHRTAIPKQTSYRTTYSCHHQHPRAFRAGGHK